MEIAMNIQKTLLVCVILMVLGDKIRDWVPVLKKYCIPSAVVGGLSFAIINLILNTMGIARFTFDDTMQKFFMYVFFTCAGFQASFALLKQGGVKIVLFLGLAALLAFFQNLVAVVLSFVLKITPMIGLMTGSIPMTGGHGNAASFGPLADEMGFVGASDVAIAAATFGLVAGCIIGGPLANHLIKKKDLYHEGDEEADVAVNSEEEGKVKNSKTELAIYTRATILVFIGLGLGAYFKEIFDYFLPDSVNLPVHVMGMIGGCVLTNLVPKFSKQGAKAVPNFEIDLIGDVSLALFVTMAVMSMRLWELAQLAGPMVILLVAQVLLIIIFVRFITFNVMGRNYNSAVISAGHIGFGMGAVPVSMANMKVVCDKYRYSKLAFFIVPIIGGMFSNFTNAIIISLFMNYCGGL